MSKGRTVGLIFGFIGTALVAAALAGGGVYLWQRSHTDQIEQNVAALSNQVQELKNTASSSSNQAANAASNTSANNATATSSDARRLITYQDQQGYGIDNITSCLSKEPEANAFNMATATTTVPYAAEGLGFSLDVPWNPVWGTSICRVNPYEATAVGDGQQALLFGPLTQGEGGLGRIDSLSSLPHRTATQAIAAIKKLNDGMFVKQPTTSQLAGFDVVSYEVNGLCDVTIAEIIGSGSHNYELTAGCDSPTYAKALSLYEGILRGFKMQ